MIGNNDFKTSLVCAFQDWGSEKLVKAQDCVKDNPWDLESWGILIREAQIRSVGEMRPFFESLIVSFPTCGRYWKIYIEQEVTYDTHRLPRSSFIYSIMISKPRSTRVHGHVPSLLKKR